MGRKRNTREKQKEMNIRNGYVLQNRNKGVEREGLRD
jgi:hypothetical protein